VEAPEESGTEEGAAGEPVPEPPPPEADETRTGDYTVQLGAFSTRARALRLMERARRAGFEPRLVTVPGSTLLRVRVGRFTGASDALELRDRLRSGGFEAILRDDAAREESGAG
jgi:cell division protein FtsN